MIPLTRTSPLFGGTITIAGGTYALMGVNVEPNDAFLIPFVTRRNLRYRQEFSQYEGGFWMPVDIRIDGSFDVNVPAVTFPRFGFTQTSVVYSYELNAPIPDSVRAKPRLSVDSSVAVFDSTLWSETKVLPLTPVEERAYATLDSTKTLDVQFRPGGIAMTLSAGGESTSLLEYLDLSYDRVEGFHAGVQYAIGVGDSMDGAPGQCGLRVLAQAGDMGGRCHGLHVGRADARIRGGCLLEGGSQARPGLLRRHSTIV